MEIDDVEFAKMALIEYIAECFEMDDYTVEYSGGVLYIFGDDGNTYFITVGKCNDR